MKREILKRFPDVKELNNCDNCRFCENSDCVLKVTNKTLTFGDELLINVCEHYEHAIHGNKDGVYETSDNSLSAIFYC